MEQKIKKLEQLIEDYNELRSELAQMVINWDNGDPMSDTGLQYEKEMQVAAAYVKIKQYAIEM